MRKIFTLLAIVLPFMAMAQARQLLEIDANSFAPVQTDAISGVTIDKIGVDPSRRPCARIKMHINRMTREDIAGLSVRPVGGSVVVTRQVVATEGNGLIVEMTAKAPTRFYLHHDKYGDSNEVSLNLEGDKEYKLEAMLNTTHSIVVQSNTIDAEVYLDNIFKGKISNSYTLTIGDVYPGKHKIKVKLGSLESESEVEVNSLAIHFRINIDHDQAMPQYCLLQVTPKNATVVIDGKTYIPNEYGEVSTMLVNGSYSYSVSAKNYHEQKDNFIVNGKKFELEVKLKPAFGWIKVPEQGDLQDASVYIDDENIGTTPITSGKLPSGTHTVRIVKRLYKEHTAQVVVEDNKTTTYAPELIPNFASVTLKSGTANDRFQIFVNDKFVGYSPWTGDLEAGRAYLFESRKAGHRPTKLSLTINNEPAKQTYEIKAPTAICGLLDVNSTPANANVYVDNVLVGKTPLIHKVVIGNHTVSIRKEGFEDERQSVTIEEKKPKKINISLKKKVVTTYSSSSSSDDNLSSSYSSSSSNSKYCLIKYKSSNAIVYVNGSYKGYAGRNYSLNYGDNYVVVLYNGSYYGRLFRVNSSSAAVLDMTGAPKVNSIHRQYSSSTGSSYSASSSYAPKKNIYKSSSSYSASKYRTKYNGGRSRSGSGSWDSFNLGASVGLGIMDELASESDDKAYCDFHLGLLLRMWRYNSKFNAMTGLYYMRGAGYNFLNIPLTVNWNILADDDFGIYIGAGTELSMKFDSAYDSMTGGYTPVTWLSFPVVLQGGLGFRHHDINAYLKFYTGHDFFTMGVRYTYFF